MIQVERPGMENHVSEFQEILFKLVNEESEAHQQIVTFQSEEPDANSDLWQTAYYALTSIEKIVKRSGGITFTEKVPFIKT